MCRILAGRFVAHPMNRPNADLQVAGRRMRKGSHRAGKVLILLALTLPMLFGIIGLVVDVGLMSVDSQNLKHAADAAATAGTLALQQGSSNAAAEAAAVACLQQWNGLSNVSVTVHIPPVHGSFAGRSLATEVAATRQRNLSFIRLIRAGNQAQVSVSSVAAVEPSTTGAAVAVLDPSPPLLTITGLPVGLPVLPTLSGGLEIEGAGTVNVDGAALVNTTWGGVNEHGEPAGASAGPPYGIACTPVLPTSRLRARDIRVVGGVDLETNYGSFVAGQPSPLRASRMPVPDPFLTLPTPTLTVDPTNVNAATRGGVRVATLPLLTTTLQPGVYDWIEIVTGKVTMKPGIYVIRNKNPITNISLNVLGGTVTANGVMFYITDTANYSAMSGIPDNGDGETTPARPSPLNIAPSVVINTAVAVGSQFSPLDDAGSPFDRMLIYQRRQDYRPIVINYQALLGGATIRGRLYAKWGHISFISIGNGNYDLSFVAGTVRFVSALGITVSPATLLDSAKDVYLVN